MFSKINVSSIISDHFKTLKNNDTNKTSFVDIGIFVLLPIVVALIFFCLDISLSESLVNILIAAFSIFVGLLLNLLMLVYDIVNKNYERQGVKEKPLRKIYLKQIFSNISFTVFLSIIIIISLLFTFPENYIIKCVSSLVSVFLMSQFLLTLLMILKRVHVLLSKEFSN